jgi:hypothetical protein
VPSVTAQSSVSVVHLEWSGRLSLQDTAGPMESPKLCERVRLCGDPHPFFVISVDEERQLVDLMPVSGRGPCLDSVPFSAVQHSLPEPPRRDH